MAATFGEVQEAIDKALNDTVGFHGQWVLAVECMDTDTGELQAVVVTDQDGTAWTHLGLAHLLAGDVAASCRKESG